MTRSLEPINEGISLKDPLLFLSKYIAYHAYLNVASTWYAFIKLGIVMGVFADQWHSIFHKKTVVHVKIKITAWHT